MHLETVFNTSVMLQINAICFSQSFCALENRIGISRFFLRIKQSMVEHFRAKSLNNSNRQTVFRSDIEKLIAPCMWKLWGKTFDKTFWMIWTNGYKETNDIHGSCKLKKKYFFAHLLMVLTGRRAHTNTHFKPIITTTKPTSSHH